MSSHEELSPLLAAYELNLLSNEDREKFERHLAECDLCFEDAYSFSPVTEQLARKPAKLAVRKTSRAMQYIRLAVAASLVICSAAGYWIFKQSGTVVDDRTRGAKVLQLISPQENQTTHTPVSFTWRPESAASFYVIHIRPEKAGEVKFRTEVPAFAWPAAQDTYHPGRYRWSVDACFSDGTVISRSHPQLFVLN